MVEPLPLRALFVVLALSALAALAGCKKATLDDAPDATVDCNSGAHTFCEAGVPPGQGCTIAAGDTDPHLAQIGAGTYPIGCVSNFVAAQRDVGGDCKVDAICRCNAGVDGGIATPHWACFP